MPNTLPHSAAPGKGAGRFAPSPTGQLHVGNLRTALLAWLWARQSGRRFVLRVEDIDTQRSRPEFQAAQLADLAAFGIEWDEVVVQSGRFAAYEAAVSQLPHYECYCSRKDIQQAASAPHAIPGHYPGTCRNLDAATRAARRAELAASGRTPALRLRAAVTTWRFQSDFRGTPLGQQPTPTWHTGPVDDLILRRGHSGSGEPDWAYNLAVVVDDLAQGVDQVVRGDDLYSSAARQAYLAHLLGGVAPVFSHVPLVINTAGQRLAKRDAAATLQSLCGPAGSFDAAAVARVLQTVAGTLGVPASRIPQLRLAADLLDCFDPRWLSRKAVVWPPQEASL